MKVVSLSCPFCGSKSASVRKADFLCANSETSALNSELPPFSRRASESHFPNVFIGVFLLIDPNGGESLVTGKAYPIKWLSICSISKAVIEYSTDNGSNWMEVSPPNTGNNGLYNWLVPVADSNQCLLRVSDANDPNISDTSDGVFSIKPPMVGHTVAWGYNGQGQCKTPAGSNDEAERVSKKTVRRGGGVALSGAFERRPVRSVQAQRPVYRHR